jgi:hypothetical protein
VFLSSKIKLYDKTYELNDEIPKELLDQNDYMIVDFGGYFDQNNKQLISAILSKAALIIIPTGSTSLLDLGSTIKSAIEIGALNKNILFAGTHSSNIELEQDFDLLKKTLKEYFEEEHYDILKLRRAKKIINNSLSKKISYNDYFSSLDEVNQKLYSDFIDEWNTLLEYVKSYTNTTPGDEHDEDTF